MVVGVVVVVVFGQAGLTLVKQDGEQEDEKDQNGNAET